MLAHDDIHRSALRAAAKVALTLSTASMLGACGAQVTPGAAPPQDDAGDVEASTDTAVADTVKVPDAIIDATACGPITPDAATPSQLKCCAAKVKAAFDPGAPPDAGGEAGVGSPDPAIQECCREVFTVDDPTLDLGLTFEHWQGCCFALSKGPSEDGWHGCTPWGPPMPPAMPEVVS